MSGITEQFRAWPVRRLSTKAVSDLATLTNPDSHTGAVAILQRLTAHPPSITMHSGRFAWMQATSPAPVPKPLARGGLLAPWRPAHRSRADDPSPALRSALPRDPLRRRL